MVPIPPPPIPARAETGRHIGLLFGDMAGSDTGACDAVIACQVHSISPEPLPRSSTRAPDRRRSAAPSVASLSGVIGLWMR